jgi:TRAP-type mannitol/chloroaromatic compound transport system permease large subunit
MRQIYASILPFLGIKLLVLAAIVMWPAIGTWLPGQIGS